MSILPLHPEIGTYLRKRNLLKKFAKQTGFLEHNPFHPSLHTELLEPRHMRIWSFRVDKRYRALFIFHSHNSIEILEVNDHYR